MTKQEMAREELLRDHERTNYEIARDLDVSKATVANVRHEMEEEGLIPIWRATDEDRERREMIRQQLLANHETHNYGIARDFDISVRTVLKVRHEMEDEGLIPRWKETDEDDEIRERIRQQLLENHERTNGTIVMELILPTESRITVRRMRHQMEGEGLIPKWRGQTIDHDLIERELLSDPLRNNWEIAEIADCSNASVLKHRHRLEREGLIPIWRGSRHGGGVYRPEDESVDESIHLGDD